MSRTEPTCPSTEINDKRQMAKAKRGFGQKHLKIGEAFDEDGKARNKAMLDMNAQSKDPLFKVRGIERFRRCNPLTITG